MSLSKAHSGRYTTTEEVRTVKFPDQTTFTFRRSWFGKEILQISEVFEDYNRITGKRIRRMYVKTRDATSNEALVAMKQLFFIKRINMIDAKNRHINGRD